MLQILSPKVSFMKSMDQLKISFCYAVSNSVTYTHANPNIRSQMVPKQVKQKTKKFSLHPGSRQTTRDQMEDFYNQKNHQNILIKLASNRRSLFPVHTCLPLQRCSPGSQGSLVQTFWFTSAPLPSTPWFPHPKAGAILACPRGYRKTVLYTKFLACCFPEAGIHSALLSGSNVIRTPSINNTPALGRVVRTATCRHAAPTHSRSSQ